MYRLAYIVFFLLLFQEIGYAQNYEFKPHIWKLTAISGDVRVRGAYGYGSNITVAGENTTLENGMFSIGASLYTRSFIYHPNMLSLDISGGYEPRLTKFEQIESLNDFSTKFFSGRAYFLNRLRYKFQLFYGFNENFSFREGLAPVRYYDENYGAIFTLNNKYFPGTIQYRESKQRQREIETDRKIRREEKLLLGNFSQNYGNQSKATIDLKRWDYTNMVDDSNIGMNSYTNQSITNDLNGHNTLNFSKNKDISLRTRLNYNDFESNSIHRRRYMADNFFRVELPKNFRVRANHLYSFIQTNEQDTRRNSLIGTVRHKLYESLTTNVAVNYMTEDNSFYEQKRANLSIDLKYTKSLPLDSRLSLFSAYRKTLTKREGESTLLQVYEEPYILSDQRITLIDNPDVLSETVVVKNSTGGIIYQEEQDYFLIPVGNFLQIQRTPGGLIPNNSSVLVDYVYKQPGNYDLNSDGVNFRANLSMFQNAFDIYYNYSSRKYEDPELIPNLKMDYFDRNVYGTKIDFDVVSAGVEYDDYASNLIPYKLLTYFININGKFRKRIKYNFILQRDDYFEFGPDKQTQRFDIANANVFYLFNYNSNLNFNFVYRGQEINDVEAEWLTARLEYMTKFKKLSLRTNLNFHRRNIDDQRSYTIGANIILSRHF